MEKHVEISMLCQIYGKILTEKQYEFINDYYDRYSGIYLKSKTLLDYIK